MADLKHLPRTQFSVSKAIRCTAQCLASGDCKLATKQRGLGLISHHKLKNEVVIHHKVCPNTSCQRQPTRWAIARHFTGTLHLSDLSPGNAHRTTCLRLLQNWLTTQPAHQSLKAGRLPNNTAGVNRMCLTSVHHALGCTTGQWQATFKSHLPEPRTCPSRTFYMHFVKPPPIFARALENNAPTLMKQWLRALHSP